MSAPDPRTVALAEVVSAYDRYRGRGVLPAPTEYREVVDAIERGRVALAAETQQQPERWPGKVSGMSCGRPADTVTISLDGGICCDGIPDRVVILRAPVPQQEPEHKTRVIRERPLDSSGQPGDRQYVARCECGWWGKPYRIRSSADQDAEDHRRAPVPQPAPSTVNATVNDGQCDSSVPQPAPANEKSRFPDGWRLDVKVGQDGEYKPRSLHFWREHAAIAAASLAGDEYARIRPLYANGAVEAAAAAPDGERERDPESEPGLSRSNYGEGPAVDEPEPLDPLTLALQAINTGIKLAEDRERMLRTRSGVVLSLDAAYDIRGALAEAQRKERLAALLRGAPER